MKLITNLIKQFKYVFVKCLSVLFFVASSSDVLTGSVVREKNHLKKVLMSSVLRKEFAKFLDNTLKQVPSDKFFEYIDDIVKKHNPANDKEFYEKIVENIHQIKSRLSAYYSLKAFQTQKRIVAYQVSKILGEDVNKNIKGCLEIGSSGTYIANIKSFLSIGGDFYVLNNNKKWNNVFQNILLNPFKGFVPYSHFITLEDYSKIKETDIPSNSLDLVVCFTGLHNVPRHKLDEFILSISRILKRDGIFLLREYDCRNNQKESLLNAAHTITNAFVIGKTEAEQECRNFNNLNFWIRKLNSYRLKFTGQKLDISDDPTLNTILKFKKI